MSVATNLTQMPATDLISIEERCQSNHPIVMFKVQTRELDDFLFITNSLKQFSKKEEEVNH